MSPGRSRWAPLEGFPGLADHLGHDIVPRHGIDGVTAANPAVPHDHDAIGDGEDLGEAVRDEDDGDATRLERAHAIEQALQLVLGQRRRRLVENQEARLLGKRPSDDDELLRSKVERRHGGFGIDLEAEIGQRAAGAERTFGDVDHAPALRLVVQRDVLGNRHLGNDIDLLRDEGDTGCLCSGDARRTERRAGEGNRPVISSSGVRAGEDLDERRLAGAVLAEESDDLAGRNGEADIVERADAGKELDEVLRDEDGLARGGAGGRRRPLRDCLRHPHRPIGRSASCPARSYRPR